jgi:DNA-directed RNA polymerase subunit M/transcription elongation factor TFIIS
MPTARPVTQLSDAFCLNCCEAIVAAVGGHRETRAGDILLCQKCGYAMEFSRDLILHEPSAAALSYIASKLHRANAN